MCHRWRQRGFGGRRGQAAGVVHGGDFGWGAHHGQENWQQHQAVQHPQNGQDGQHSKEIPERWEGERNISLEMQNSTEKEQVKAAGGIL